MNRLVLDTHAWIWWLSSPNQIPRKAKRALDRAVAAGEHLRVSAISVWELAMLVTRNRLELAIPLEEWVSAAEAVPNLQYVPIDHRVALRSVALPNFPHRDPADRMIVATAVALGATLVTADEKLHGYSIVPTVWT